MTAKIRISWLIGVGLSLVAVFLGVQVFVLVPLLQQLSEQMAVTNSLDSSHHHHVGAVLRREASPNKRHDFKENNNNNDDDNDESSSAAFDIVTLVHHDDLKVFVEFGLESWKKFVVTSPETTNIFVICTPEAQRRLLQKKYKGDPELWDRVVLVSQVVFPFSLDIVGVHSWNNKPTWIYQQLLKVYAYQVLSTKTAVAQGSDELPMPTLKRHFLLMDSDTVAVRSFPVMSPQGKAIFNIAAESTGSFSNDCTLGFALVREVFKDGSVVQKAFPDPENGQKFTSITHQMMFDGFILEELLHTISSIHQQPAWQVLSSLKSSVLSEWELYMAWMMTHYKDQILLLQTPYMNSGQLDRQYLEWLTDKRDVAYLSRHDDYNANNQCCVNSNWPTIVEYHAKSCGCCTLHGCQPPKITCDLLSMPGCVQNETTGILSFVEHGGWQPPPERPRVIDTSKIAGFTTVSDKQHAPPHFRQHHLGPKKEHSTNNNVKHRDNLFERFAKQIHQVEQEQAQPTPNSNKNKVRLAYSNTQNYQKQDTSSR